MARYRFDVSTQAAFEQSLVPIGIFQVVDGRVVALVVSDGLCELFGYKDRAEAMKKMDEDMYWSVHPDDVARVAEVARGFIQEDKPYNLVFRIKREGGYRLIHARGKRVITETGDRIAVLWYIDEGALVLDAKAEQDAERIEELQTSMRSLLNNMPAMSFSKDVETGIYLACNQAFAEFANRTTPAGVIGLTDYEIFDPETAAHFTEDDRKALSMDEPYSFLEHALDAAGNPRQLQTTKQKFIDGTGRLCLLGMAMDVTEGMRAKAESEQAKASYQEALNASAIYESIIDALSEDYFNLYYVNAETGEYIEYGSRTEQGQRTVERRGNDFFADSAKNAPLYIYEEDRERFLAVLDKEKLLAEIERHGAYIFPYRLQIDGAPTYVSMKVTRATGDDGHIIIGVSNVDTQVRDRMAAERAVEDRRSYERLSALSGNLIVLYYVDIETNQYKEFSSSKGYEGLGIAKQGSDFFADTNKYSFRTIHPEDQALFHLQVTKENMLATIAQGGLFTLDYRLMSGGLPTYVRLKAAKVEEDGKAYLIVGLLDEDARIRQEREYARDLSVARKMATVDSLTGIKNKHAYVQWEQEIDAAIEEESQEPFAVVVCDINSLKAVNDLYGHKEGDTCIKNACARICDIFSHSPVFRVGGDEFVVILTREDYRLRQELMERVNAVPKDRSKIRIGETFSAGMAEYDESRHSSFQGVLEEADRAMYERKQFLKKIVLKEDAEPDEALESEVIPVINVQKRILVVDDMSINRDIMGDLLGEDYDISYASNGDEALEMLRSQKGEIDLVLLDLLMPGKDGREVLAEMQVDEDLMSIPVVVVTVDQKAELDCLKIGAMDFIPKPYPNVEIVRARIDKCIELAEDRDLIRHTERDRLTGLLNKDYFYRYVGRLDHIYKGTDLDAVACDVNRFYAANKQYGRRFGDLVLRTIGTCMRKLARKTGGICCRQGVDTFLLYCPHQDDYEQLIQEFASEVLAEGELADKLHMRFGVFSNARQEADIEERFVRAKIAADRVRDKPQTICGYYDLG